MMLPYDLNLMNHPPAKYSLPQSHLLTGKKTASFKPAFIENLLARFAPSIFKIKYRNQGTTKIA